MKKKILITSIISIFILSIVCGSIFLNRNIHINTKTYKDPTAEPFSLYGSTGWTLKNQEMRTTAEETSESLTTVIAGEPFLILEESGNYWKIEYNNKIGYVNHDYCMINLPDVIPSIKYFMHLYRYTQYYFRYNNGVRKLMPFWDPPTEYKSLYGTDCVNGVCKSITPPGTIKNDRKLDYEFISPVLYSTAKKIALAQAIAVSEGYSLRIQDTYRPKSVSKILADEIRNQYETDAEIRANLDYSTDSSNVQHYWGLDWFLPQEISAQNLGAGVDIEIIPGPSSENTFNTISTVSIRYKSPDSKEYSKEMMQNENIRALDRIMTSVGFEGSPSLWWHFDDNESYDRIKNEIPDGCDFMITSIVSKNDFFRAYAPDSTLTTKGDLNADGVIDDSDVYLIYWLNNYLSNFECTTCQTLISYSDLDNDGSVTLNDVYQVLNRDNFITTTYQIGDDYIYTGTDTDSNVITSKINVKNRLNITTSIENNNYNIKYNDDIIKNYKIVNISSSKYDLSSDSVNVTDQDIASFLSNIQFTNSTGCVYNGTECLVQGNFAKGNKLYIKYNDNVIKQYDLKFPITNLTITNKTNEDLNIGDTYQINYNITPTYTNENVILESSNKSVATISENGLITAIGNGISIISIKTVDGAIYDYFTINVTGTPKYTVTYRDGNNTTTREYTEGQQVQINNPTKPGYIFKGWKYNNKTYTLGDELLMPNKNIELIAEWELTNSNISTYNVTNNIIEKVPINKNISNFIQELGLDSSVYNVKIYDKNNTEKQDENVVTGDKVKITLKDGTEVSNYYIAVFGDANCDGELSVGDIKKIYNYLFNNFEGVPDYIKKAADYNNDGEQSVGDIVKIYRALINS